jgi:hypothetical protein
MDLSRTFTTDCYEMNYAGERGGILAGIQREYSRKAQYLDHLEEFLRGL